jgi:DNA-binding NarL/FixJ family response regulator
MRVAIADDSGLFRAGLASVLIDLGAEVIIQTGTGDELVAAMQDLRPENIDVAVLDIRMPPTYTNEGLTTALSLRSQPDGPAVMLLSTYADATHAAALLAGAPTKIGYLLKDRVDEPTTLWAALTRIGNGEVVIDPSLVTRLITQQRHLTALARLTDQERRVLQLLSEGRSNDGISRQLWVTPKTVETHIGRIFTKLDLGSAPQDNRRVLATLTWLRQTEPHNQLLDAPPPA